MSEAPSTDTDTTDLPDPLEPIPVIRHHLHEVLLTLNDLGTLVGALDLVDAARSPSTRQRSHLSLRLERQEQLLEGYLGLLDEDEDDNAS